MGTRHVIDPFARPAAHTRKLLQVQARSVADEVEWRACWAGTVITHMLPTAIRITEPVRCTFRETLYLLRKREGRGDQTGAT